jgi:hypothetical protein
MTDEFFMLEKVRFTIHEIEAFIQLANAMMWNDLVPLIDLEGLRVRLHWLKRCERVLLNSADKQE